MKHEIALHQAEESSSVIARLGLEDAAAAADALGEAFYDYPVVRFVLGTDSRGYDRGVASLMRFFVQARLLRDEPVLGIPYGSGFGAVALVSDPAGPASPAELSDAREALWSELGPDARGRYEAFGMATGPLIRDVPRMHLNMIGVRAALRGRGLSRRLLDRVHDLAREREGSRGVSLTTENPANLPLYHRFGYEITGRGEVAPGLSTWALFRPHEPRRPPADPSSRSRQTS